MAQVNIPAGQVVEFLRKRDYVLVKELGQGACGKTVLLRDDLIDQLLVCKKYVPYAESERAALYKSFVQEIKLLHQLHHENVVRVFNYYLYPDQQTGYILMEYVAGKDIDDYVKGAPEQCTELFRQCVSGFAYLESAGTLHRDIRPGNLMVTESGRLKIIDLGFGKRVETPADFDKSISLNWWCEIPNEFRKKQYEFCTEVYFVGMLFAELISDNGIKEFKHQKLLERMCERDPAKRIPRFSAVVQAVSADSSADVDFTKPEQAVYRRFSELLCRPLTGIEQGGKYITDLSTVRTRLGEAYRTSMLEEDVPNVVTVLRCFIQAGFKYNKGGFSVYVLKEFYDLFRVASDEKCRVMLANLQNKFDAVTRYTKPPFDDKDIPF